MINNKTIALLHPGEMGAAIGGCLVARGIRVLWVSDGRSAATRARAESCGLKEIERLDRGLEAADVVLSICPPRGAGELARAVASTGFNGVFVDANAIAAATSREIRLIVEAAGAAFVDGGIIGPPPTSKDRCRLYLCGQSSEDVAALFASTNLQAIVLDGPIGTASALKMCYAAWTKGTMALLAGVRALALSQGINANLLDEWQLSQPNLAQQSDALAAKMRKAWRWAGEMEEIAASFEDAGLPGGFHRAAGEIYGRLAGFKDGAESPSLTRVTKALLQPASVAGNCQRPA
jgi:3-hydroxyisobutyrate dehydrogenase-like beta-hydroxyacid dehydrogenase